MLLNIIQWPVNEHLSEGVEHPVSIDYVFSNGYTARVLRHKDSYGGPEGEFEIQVLRWGKITYDTPITNDVLAWVRPGDVPMFLGRIEELPPAECPICGHTAY